MKNIFEYINEDKKQVAYVTRSLYGNWTIALKKDGAFTNRQVMSHQQLTDSDVSKLREMEIPVFDFLKCKKEFRENLLQLRKLNRELCI